MKEMWKKSDPNHQGESWYSHKDGDVWCNGKPPKPNSNAVQSQALDVILRKVIGIETRLDKMAMFLSGRVETKPATKEELKNVPF